MDIGFFGDFTPELLAVLFTAIVVLIAISIGIFRNIGSVQQSNLTIDQILADQELMKKISEGNGDVKYIIDYLRERDAQQRDPISGHDIIHSIFSKIDWDVAGLIGVMVTFVLMFMVAGDRADSIPKELFAGWLTIVGYYFGKNSAAK